MSDSTQPKPARLRTPVTPPRTQAPFRPLTARYMVSAKANRNDADERPLPHFFYASGGQDAHQKRRL
jgi:hypothetical protein